MTVNRFHNQNKKADVAEHPEVFDHVEEIVGEIEDEHDLRPLELLLRAARRETRPAEPARKPPSADDRQLRAWPPQIHALP